MEQVEITENVINILTKLLKILHSKRYFATKENAYDYVISLYSFINNLPNVQHRNCKNIKYGVYYATYKANKHTSWYITFDIEDKIYLVKSIINNHTKNYPRYIRGL